MTSSITMTSEERAAAAAAAAAAIYSRVELLNAEQSIIDARCHERRLYASRRQISFAIFGCQLDNAVPNGRTNERTND